MGTGKSRMSVPAEPCRVCGMRAVYIGKRESTRRAGYVFTYYHCGDCHFSFISNPLTDYENIYSQDYYSGTGADPMVDYLFELDSPERTIRNYEWSGIYSAIRTLVSNVNQAKWLDFGCGGGGLVRFCRTSKGADIVGFEQGWIAAQAKARGIPILESQALDSLEQSFDIVTAIEVLEHVPDPLVALRQIRRVLRPGGIFFLTTGNAQPWRNRLLEWSYTSVPEVHVSFYEPATLRIALEKTGFRAQTGRYLPGLTDVIKFKVLKTLGVKQRHAFHRLLPWAAISRLVDLKYGVSRHPVGIAV
jgi:SAM-dependent methyltransferase